MRKPWVIGLLSLVPGLGLLVLGEVRKALAAVGAVALLAAGALAFRNDTVFTIVFVLAVVVWTLQWMMALTEAQRQAGIESGTAPTVRPVTPAPLAPSASASERSLHKARQALMEVMPPAENLRVALNGFTGVPSLGSILLALVSGGMPGDRAEPVLLGITEHDLILVRKDMWGKPAALQRFPLDRVRVGKSIEGALFDEFALDTGEGKPLRVRMEKSVHEETRRLLAILSGEGQPDIPAWQPAPAAPASPRFASSTLPEGRGAASHPMLTSGLLGGLGGAVGALASAIVLTLLGLIFGEPLFGTPDFGEGLGILLGLYCVVMFPIGGGILGAIPGILTGWLRVSHDEPITPLPLAIPGFLTVLTLSVAAAAALFFLVPQP